MEGSYFKHSADIKEGKSFGELALLKEDIRKATIKCETHSHFATLDKANFHNSLQRIEAKRLNQLIEFLQNIPAFKSQSRKAISKFTYLLKREKFTRGQTVYAEGQEADKIFIVQKGEFELSKKLPRGDQMFEGQNLQDNSVHNYRTQKKNILAITLKTKPFRTTTTKFYFWSLELCLVLYVR